jgi:hypothetical protein
MRTSIIAAKNSLTMSSVIGAPTEVVPLEERDFFGPPPLIDGEDPAAYAALLARVTAEVEPKGALEDIWVREVVDLVWEALRWRRLKASLLQAAAHRGLEEILQPLAGYEKAKGLARRWANRERKALKLVDRHLAAAGLTIDAVMAQTLALKLDPVERIDRMLAGAEARRNNALREIERHRETLAMALRQTAKDVEDAEFTEIGPGASEAQAQ